MYDKYVNAAVGLILVTLGCFAAPDSLQEVVVGGGLGIIGAPVLTTQRRDA